MNDVSVISSKPRLETLDKRIKHQIGGGTECPIFRHTRFFSIWRYWMPFLSHFGTGVGAAPRARFYPTHSSERTRRKNCVARPEGFQSSRTHTSTRITLQMVAWWIFNVRTISNSSWAAYSRWKNYIGFFKCPFYIRSLSRIGENGSWLYWFLTSDFRFVSSYVFSSLWNAGLSEKLDTFKPIGPSSFSGKFRRYTYTHRIHVCYINGNMDPINIPPLCYSIYSSTMDPSWDRHNLFSSRPMWVWINTLGELTSIYQLFWCSPGVQGFDTLPCVLLHPFCGWKLFPSPRCRHRRGCFAARIHLAVQWPLGSWW